MAKRKKSKIQQQSEPVASTATTGASESEEAQDSREAEPDNTLPTPISPATGPTATEPAPGATEIFETATPEALPEPSAEATEPAPPPTESPETTEIPEAAAPAGAETTSAQAWPDASVDEASVEVEAPAESSDFAGVWQDPADAAAASSEPSGDAAGQSTEPIMAAPLEGSRLEAIIESLLFVSDKALSLGDLKRLLGERDGKKITAAVQSLMELRKGSGIEVVAFSSGWHLRTNPEHANWVSGLLAGKPVRLSRAMLETLSIVAYRQPVTRPEIDDIRGVDCGPVLRTLLDRSLVRIIGKKEEVGRPMLYGTTPEFLRIFNLRDLGELPTLREFYELTAEDRSQVDAKHGPEGEVPATRPDVTLGTISRSAVAPEEEDADPLLDELDEASQLAKNALGDLQPAADNPAQAEEVNPDSVPENEPPMAPAGE